MDQATLAVVAENLRRWQDTMWMQRLDPMSPAMESIMLESGLAAAIELGQSESEYFASVEEGRRQTVLRDRRVEELDELYGDAVRQVPGAESQDLVLLEDVGALLVELKDGVKPTYFSAQIMGEQYLETIRKR